MRYVRLCVALALLAGAQACDNGEKTARNEPTGVCTPGAHTSADPASVTTYCTDFFAAFCDRAFGDCGAVLGTGGFSSATECRTTYAASCAAVDFSNDWYDAPCASACIDVIRGAPCSVFQGNEPQACTDATGTVATPPPPCLATISSGTIADTISSSDPVYSNGHARSYCISLTAGHTVTIQTSAPLSGTPIGDTVLYLLGPDGTLITSNDDYLGLYSQIVTIATVTGTHRIVVSGYTPSYVGSYQLTVTAP